MSDIDRVAIHEVMEQQTVTIAKAGIHTTLNARCSVVAAANPVWGQYDETKRPHQNIALPDSLLSRFDLLFIVLDKVEEARDREVSMHILEMHRYVPPGLEEGQPIDDIATMRGQAVLSNGFLNHMDGNDDVEDTPIYQKLYLKSHAVSNGTPSRRSRRTEKEVLTVDFCKKYLHYAKNRIKPILTAAASEYIVKAYGDLRNDEQPENRFKTMPVTARTLETLIRLATAHAKARLSNIVEERDAHAAHDLLSFAMFKETAKDVRKKRRRLRRQTGEENVEESSGTSSNDDDDDDDGNGRGNGTVTTAREANTPQRRSSRRNSASAANTPRRSAHRTDFLQNEAINTEKGDEDMMMEDVGEVSQDVSAAGTSMTDAFVPDATQSSSSITIISPSRLEMFRGRVAHLRNLGELGENSIVFHELLRLVNDVGTPASAYTASEAEAALTRMEEDNMVMYRHGMVIII